MFLDQSFWNANFALWDGNGISPFRIIMLVPLALFLFKDIVKGQSIGKRILKVKVVNEEGNLPSAFKLFIRNITIFIWSIEVILMLLQKKRLGERITGTSVVDN